MISSTFFLYRLSRSWNVFPPPMKMAWASLAARYGFSAVWIEEKVNPQASKAFLAVAAYS